MSGASKESSSHKSQLLIGGLLATLALGFAFGRYAYPTPNDPSDQVSTCNKDYPLLRTDLDCTEANDAYQRVNNIQDTLTTYIDEQKTAGNITRASVFFRDLSTRRWAAVNKDDLYAPGSLLKVALAVAYFKLSEIEPSVMQQGFVYKSASSSLNSMENFQPEEKLVPGQTYLVDELISHMIEQSDNDTATILGQSIDMNFFNRVLSDLGIHLPTSGGNDQDFLSVDRYASILRTLYLASYLNIDGSQKLLTLMSKTSFSEGIAGGVPDEIPVAHKFGEREVTDPKSGGEISAELHDCGIVYKPDHPYILCVMTEGKSYDSLSKVLTEISKKVYEGQ